MNKVDSGGLSALEYLQLLEGKVEQFREITRLSTEDKEEYQRLLSWLDATNAADVTTHSAAIKGKALEDIVAFILSKAGGVFVVLKNLRTSTNEIDQLITLTDRGKIFKSLGIINILGDYFLGECKNYAKKIGVEWVGKLCSLTMASNCNLTVLFSYHGLTGRGWEDSCGLTKKLHLMRERQDDRLHIISFMRDDFQLITEGVSFIELIDSKILGLRTDTDCAGLITPHPAMEDL